MPVWGGVCHPNQLLKLLLGKKNNKRNPGNPDSKQGDNSIQVTKVGGEVDEEETGAVHSFTKQRVHQSGPVNVAKRALLMLTYIKHFLLQISPEAQLHCICCKSCWLPPLLSPLPYWEPSGYQNVTLICSCFHQEMVI